MLVKDYMTRHPLMAAPDMSLVEAQRFMGQNNIRHLPVVGDGKRLLGLVTRQSLLVDPGRLGSLNVWEIAGVLSGLKVKDVMIKAPNVITVSQDITIEEAARVMVERRIGCLPVVQDDVLVGIITETDIFKALLDVLGTRTPGIRVTLAVHEGKGILAALTHDVSAMGANIISLLTSEGELPGERAITFKVNDVDPALLRQALDKLNVKIVDFREA